MSLFDERCTLIENGHDCEQRATLIEQQLKICSKLLIV